MMTMTRRAAPTLLRAIGVALAAGGRTYAEISAAHAAAAGEADEKPAELRQTAFMGMMLRSSLLGAYQAWQVTSLVIGLGVVLTGTGSALAVTGAALATEA
jgi:hypothetical protein